MKFFWSVWTIGLLTAGGFLYFFVIGIGDGSVSSFNIVLWSGLLAGLAAVVGGSYALNAKGHRVLATCLACLLAIPALLALAFFLLILITHPRWN